ncbi:hypothetical protein XFF6992_460060 [Xanthomonas citri pv. fuscans]|nr:hypothetical protein XFF7767_1000007 [Xanthomonas citri pv. fuscans]SOO12526.1 hypothetical protein XFF7766_1120006 [Xanthomonas citri pv. fuscans]SOO20430.1 hypothetical protein XFF6992_460060 [Xanthomonas citri pv. fuscans]
MNFLTQFMICRRDAYQFNPGYLVYIYFYMLALSNQINRYADCLALILLNSLTIPN